MKTGRKNGRGSRCRGGGALVERVDEGEEREVREMGISIVVAGSEESLSFRTEKRPQLNHFEEQVGWNGLCLCV